MLVWYAWQPVALLSLLMKESTVLAPNCLPSLLHPTIPAVSLVGIRQRRMYVCVCVCVPQWALSSGVCPSVLMSSPSAFITVLSYGRGCACIWQCRSEVKQETRGSLQTNEPPLALASLGIHLGWIRSISPGLTEADGQQSYWNSLKKISHFFLAHTWPWPLHRSEHCAASLCLRR